MATKRFFINLEVAPDFGQELKSAVAELEAQVVKVGIKTFGPDYEKIVNTPLFTSGGIKFGRTPRGMRAALSDLYAKAWRERYEEIASKYAAYASERHIKWKQSHQGDRPYDDGRYWISQDTPARMTNHLYRSVEKDLMLLRNSTDKYGPRMTFANLSVTGGFIFNPSSYPHSISKNTVDTMSYVERFIGTLLATGVLSDDENLVDFSQARWNQIALVMAQYAERQWIGEVEGFLKSWNLQL